MCSYVPTYPLLLTTMSTTHRIPRFHCVFCGSSFDIEANLLRHMNNPNSSCRPRRGNPLSDNFCDSAPTSNETDLSMEIDESSFTTSIPSATLYSVINHPAPIKELHGKGKSFMDAFHDDEYAQERENNLFYPFASREEWQLASYLLCSDLSNAAIDEFLKLDLVRLLYIYIFVHNC